MTERTRNRSLVAAVAVLALIAASLLPIIVSSGDAGPREIRVVVRDMTFYLDGRPEPNPTLVLRAGEQVRLRLRNEDGGISHDFAVTGWNVGTRLLSDPGEEDTITFTVPEQRGSTPYVCTPHSKMMSGTLRVE